MHTVLGLRKQWWKSEIAFGLTTLFYNIMGLCGNLSLCLATVSFRRWSYNVMEIWELVSEWVNGWVSEWVRMTIECRTSSVFDTMLPILFVLEYLWSSTFAQRMIGCFMSETNCFVPIIIFSLCLRNPKVIFFFSFCCDTTEDNEHLTIMLR